MTGTDIEWVSGELARLEDVITDIKREHYRGGPHITVTFKNNYQASIIDNDMSYGVELAVMHKGLGLVYDTPVTDDVIGYLTPDVLAEKLVQIAKLPEREVKGDG